MTKDEQIRRLEAQIEGLEAVVAIYRQAIEDMSSTRAEIAEVEQRPTREALLIEVTRLREALYWMRDFSYGDAKKHEAHLIKLMGGFVPVQATGAPS